MPRKLTLDDAVRSAEKRGGQCLSTQYTNNKDPLLWRCSNNHEWYAPLHHLKNHNKWCPTCGHDKRRLGILIAKELALSKNGKCISESYTNNRTPLIWECEKLHRWETTLSKVKNGGHWCPYCNVGRNTLEDMQAYAQEKGGHCLSDCYYNVTTKLLWICKNLHTWETTPSSIKQGRWCPMCRFKRENLCREIVSKYLGPPSANRWPDFLKTPEYPTGLQLDIPYYQHGFAIEVQGQQHEKYIEFFHRGNPDNFIKQQARDQLKEELCEENWIVLRYVWYYEDPFEKIPIILQELGLIP